MTVPLKAPTPPEGTAGEDDSAGGVQEQDVAAEPASGKGDATEEEAGDPDGDAVEDDAAGPEDDA